MLISFLRTIILYLILVITVRLMGKRQIGELEPSEFVVAILIADLASVPMQDTGIPLLSGIVPIFTILALELIFSVCSLRFLTIRRLLCGSPTVLMECGKIIQSNLARSRITIDELQQQLRANGVLDFATVHYAILETDGTISVLQFTAEKPPSAKSLKVQPNQEELPLTVISDGVVRHQELSRCGFDLTWLKKQLDKVGCSSKDVFFMTVTSSGNVYLQEVER